MLDQVISGGQTGADQGGWRAAVAFKIPTGGWMPLGYLTEDGPRPEFAELYQAKEMPTADYRARTERNVRDADGTLWFGDWMTPGGKATLDACRVAGKPFLIVYANISRPSEAREWIGAKVVRVLNVAGNRESKAPGIGERVERFMGEVFRQLGYERDGG